MPSPDDQTPNTQPAQAAVFSPSTSVPLAPGTFIEIEENPVPVGGKCHYATMADGDTIRVATFPATATETRSLLLVTGRSEFIEKYFEVVTELQSRGFAVTVMDWRGQGHSARLLPQSDIGHIDDFATYRDDLVAIIDGVARKHSAKPLTLMSHSMGGPPVLDLLASGYTGAVGAILCAPMTNFYRSKLRRQMVHVLAETAVRAGFNERAALGVREYSLEFEGNVLTSDERRHERFRRLQEESPEARVGPPTYGWVKSALDIITDLHKPDYFDNLAIPILMVSAGRDYLIDSDDHSVLAERNSLISRVQIDHAMHEILMERDPFRAQFWAAFDRFIEDPAGFETDDNDAVDQQAGDLPKDDDLETKQGFPGAEPAA